MAVVAIAILNNDMLEPAECLVMWVFGSLIMSNAVAIFSNSEGIIRNMGEQLLSVIFGMFASIFTPFGLLIGTVALVLLSFELTALVLVLLFSLPVLPITSIYYFVRCLIENR